MISVLKYGGSSVADTTKISDIANYLKSRVDNGEKLVVVLSAMGKETDELIDLASKVCDIPSGRELDQLLSLGEIKTVSLMALSLCSIGVNAKSLVGDKLGITTYGEYQNSKIKSINKDYIKEQLKLYDVLVVAGFQGVNNKNDITTLGRGGSDTTAVAFACALGVDCEIYTDVNGIFTTDPRISEQAKKLDYISYEEMCELCSLGANVMHNRSIRLASQFNTAVYVSKTLDTENGTLIFSNNPNDIRTFEKNKFTGVSVQKDVTLFSIWYENIKGVKETINEILVKNVECFEMFSQGLYNEMGVLSFVINTPNKEKEISIVKFFEKLNVVRAVNVNQYSKISLVGSGIRDSEDVVNRVIELFNNLHTEFYQLTMSDISMSLLVDKDDVDLIVNTIMTEFNI